MISTACSISTWGQQQQRLMATRGAAPRAAPLQPHHTRHRRPPPGARHGVAAAAAATSSSSSSSSSSSGGSSKQHAVVIGSGWAGLGAALALAKAGARVTLLDASESPGGLSAAFTTPGGQLVEPGVKGFWQQYDNIQALVMELGVEQPFTPWTRSSFYSPEGLQVESPIFQDLPRVPAPLGTFVHTAGAFRGLPLLPDRLSALPLLQPLLEHDLDEEAYRQYDAMSAYELFASRGVTRRLFEKFLEPMLLVTLFAPATELSAAAALGALNYFALAHQSNFDVRWARGPIGELILQPLVQRLQSLGVTILPGRRVQEIQPAGQHEGGSSQQQQQTHLGRPLTGRVVARRAGSSSGGGAGPVEVFDADAVVMAAGIPALKQLTLRSPLLGAAPDLAATLGLDCSAVLAARLWVDRKLRLPTPSNVVCGFDAGVGGTMFQLDALQDAYKGGTGSVLEVDLYHAEPLLPLSDGALIDRLLGSYVAAALPGGEAAARSLRVTDASVLRFPKAVTRFSPGSHDRLPPLHTSIANLFVAGDCVRQGPGTHGCKGLSQEKAYVTGLQAGNAAASFMGLRPVARVLPSEPDEPQVAAAKELLRTQRQLTRLASAGVAAALGGGRGGRTSSSSGGGLWGGSAPRRSPAAGLGPELLREDDALQTLLRDEVQQLGGQQQQQQQAPKAASGEAAQPAAQGARAQQEEQAGRGSSSG